MSRLAVAAKRPATPRTGSSPDTDPAGVWEAFEQTERGQLTPHAEVFARLRKRA